MFRLYANKTRLTIHQCEPTTSGSVNVYHVQFEFSGDWDGLEKTAVFQYGEKQISVPLDPLGRCVVPREILGQWYSGKKLLAGVVGTRG